MELIVKCVSKTKVEINGIIFDTVKHRTKNEKRSTFWEDGLMEYNNGNDPLQGYQCLYIKHPKGEAYFRISPWNYDKAKKLIKKYLNTFKKQYI